MVATFEDWTDVMYETMKAYRLSWIYYLSFIFIVAFIFLNMMIGTRRCRSSKTGMLTGSKFPFLPWEPQARVFWIGASPCGRWSLAMRALN